VRSITAAALAGLSFSLLPGVMQTYAPARWGEVPAILFGLGAIGVAKNPEGAVLQTGRQIRSLIGKLLPHAVAPTPALAGHASGAFVGGASPTADTAAADTAAGNTAAGNTAAVPAATADATSKTADGPPSAARKDSTSMMRAEP
jgi:branched-chain amino acid transport system permease protein